MFACIKALLDTAKYDGVPPALAPKLTPRAPTQVGFLGANQVKWLDEHIPGFKGHREAAERARGK